MIFTLSDQYEIMYLGMTVCTGYVFEGNKVN